MRSANKTAMSKPRNRTFLAAINSNDGARVRQLIAEGADIQARFGPAMLPPALHAASEGHAESLRAILASRTRAGGGVDVDEADRFGQTALSLAAVHGRAECVRALAEAGADLGKPDDRGMAPIHYAAYKVALACLQALLAAGADVDQADAEGSTPAIFACKTGQAGSLRVLMEAGADLELADAFGMVPSDHADRAGRARLRANDPRPPTADRGLGEALCDHQSLPAPQCQSTCASRCFITMTTRPIHRR